MEGINDHGIEGITIRYTEAEDAAYLKKWLMQPGMNICFPMGTEAEIDDAVRRWVSFYKWKCALTVMYEGEPCGLGALYLMPYRDLSHQCEWGLVLDNDFQGKKIGTALAQALEFLAKKHFGIEMLHIQVYGTNTRGQSFFKKLGYKEFGRQKQWLKTQDGEYRARLFMEKFVKPEAEIKSETEAQTEE